MNKILNKSKTIAKKLQNKISNNEIKNKQDIIKTLTIVKNKNLIDQDCYDMLEGVLEISEIRVRDIMIPRSQIVFIDKEQDLDTYLNTIIESAHSRFPVINEEKDKVAGILHAKDLLQLLSTGADSFSIEHLLRPAVVVPESKRVDRMLRDFKSERFHMALVIDEFGAISGLITIEDILELIVGQIEDEFDEDDFIPIRQLSKHSFSVNALTSVELFNENFKTNFDEYEFDTIGGLVVHEAKRLPNKGEIFTIEGIEFKITAANNRKVLQLRVRIPSVTEEEKTEEI